MASNPDDPPFQETLNSLTRRMVDIQFMTLDIQTEVRRINDNLDNLNGTLYPGLARNESSLGYLKLSQSDIQAYLRMMVDRLIHQDTLAEFLHFILLLCLMFFCVESFDQQHSGLRKIMALFTLSVMATIILQSAVPSLQRRVYDRRHARDESKQRLS